MAEKKIKTESKHKEVVTITKKAAEKILEFAKKENKEKFGLKLFVFPGGCSGFSYGLDFEEKKGKNDIELKQHGVSMFVDKDSVEILDGATVDYIKTEHGEGFKIDNPNVTGGCGCGSDKSGCGDGCC